MCTQEDYTANGSSLDKIISDQKKHSDTLKNAFYWFILPFAIGETMIIGSVNAYHAGLIGSDLMIYLLGLGEEISFFIPFMGYHFLTKYD